MTDVLIVHRSSLQTDFCADQQFFLTTQMWKTKFFCAVHRSIAKTDFCCTLVSNSAKSRRSRVSSCLQ